jgi:hypothetical protein
MPYPPVGYIIAIYKLTRVRRASNSALAGHYSTYVEWVHARDV